MGAKAFLAFLTAAIVVAMSAYALDQGIYVGTSLDPYSYTTVGGDTREGLRWHCLYLRAGGIHKRYFSSHGTQAEAEANTPACTLFEPER